MAKQDRSGEGGRAPAARPTAGPTRRAVLTAAAGGASLIAGTASVGGALAGAPPGAEEFPVPADPTKEQGRPTHDDGGYGTRSQFETEVRVRYPTATAESSWTLTPLAAGHGVITPSGLHFERHHGGIPTIDPAAHSLIIHGLVDRPLKFSMADLQRLPSVSRILFIECAGNGFSHWQGPVEDTVQEIHGLTSCSEWTGVPLRTLLKAAGLRDEGRWVLAEGSDAAVMTRSIPIEKCLDDALIAYAQNGEALRPEQGYPLRLILPGWEGNTHIKWLRRLEVGDQAWMTREETSKYTDLMADGRARLFTQVMEAKSVITHPSGGQRLDRPGFHEITGLAWSGRGRVTRVEVSTDGGRNWADAALQTPVLPLCHTRFRAPWQWDGRPAVLQSRATDETGYVQPTIAALKAVRGSNGKYGSFYHMNGIQSWAVDSDGSVTNVHV